MQQREVPVTRWTGNCCGIRASPVGEREKRKREVRGRGNKRQTTNESLTMLEGNLEPKIRRRHRVG